MGDFRPLETKCFERFLSARGYKFNRKSGSHDQWTKKGSRTIPVWGDEKEIPAQYIKSNCRTFGCTLQEVYEWAKVNC